MSLESTLIVIPAVVLVFLLAAKGVRFLIKKGMTTVNINETVADLIANFAFYVIIVLGAVTGLGTLGVNVSAMVASLGLGGFALGFALRDAVSNVVAGVLILVYQPFGVGDKVTASGMTGVVDRIDLRYTRLVDNDHVYLIPNQLLFKSAITLTVRE